MGLMARLKLPLYGTWWRCDHSRVRSRCCKLRLLDERLANGELPIHGLRTGEGCDAPGAGCTFGPCCAAKRPKNDTLRPKTGSDCLSPGYRARFGPFRWRKRQVSNAIYSVAVALPAAPVSKTANRADVMQRELALLCDGLARPRRTGDDPVRAKSPMLP